LLYKDAQSRVQKLRDASTESKHSDQKNFVLKHSENMVLEKIEREIKKILDTFGSQIKIKEEIQRDLVHLGLESCPDLK